MNNNTQLPTGPIIGVHPAVRDGVERVAYLDGDLLRCNTDVEFTSSPPPGPVLYRTKHTRVEIADEMVTEIGSDNRNLTHPSARSPIHSGSATKSVTNWRVTRCESGCAEAANPPG